MILKRKIFAKSEKEEVEFDYGKWNRPRVGFPKEVAVLGALGTAGAAYGGSKIAENRAVKKSVKTIEKTAKKIAIEKAKAMVGKTSSNGKKITAEDIKKLFKDPKRVEKFIRRHGEIDKVSKVVTDKLNKNMKKIKTKGAIIAGLPVLMGSLAAVGNEEYKNYLFKYGPRRVEVGQVKLVQKKKKKDDNTKK